MPRVYAGVAQLVEQLICNQPVVGSNPIASSIIMKKFLLLFFTSLTLNSYLFAIEKCNCDEGFVNNCNYVGDSFFTGTCEDSNKKILGLIEYPSGQTWYGDFYENGKEKTGKLTYPNSHYYEGEFSEDGKTFIGKFYQGKVVTTGFFSNLDEGMGLNGFGFIEFDESIRDQIISYQAGVFEMHKVRKEPALSDFVGYGYIESRNNGFKLIGSYRNYKPYGKFYIHYEDGTREINDYADGRINPKVLNEWTETDENNYQTLKSRYIKDLEIYLPIFREVEERVSLVLKNNKKD